MGITEELAIQRNRSSLEAAERIRHSRRARALRRASRMERKAEHRMIEAWRRAAKLRAAAGAGDY
ncbi:MAG: hypothetical protein JO132_05595 [Streptosporangiaceae bacterium]|nr:hypothetical protein [Streptosporangiaceae bacterium]